MDPQLIARKANSTDLHFNLKNPQFFLSPLLIVPNKLIAKSVPKGGNEEQEGKSKTMLQYP